MNTRTFRLRVANLPELPELLVTGEPCPPEPDAGVPFWTVWDMSWTGVDCVLTPEQNHAVELAANRVEAAFLDVWFVRR